MPSLRPRKSASARCEGMALIGFRVVEVVAELGAFVSLPSTTRFHDAVFFQVFAQLAEQRGVFGEALHQDLAAPSSTALTSAKPGGSALR
jgi:hypothetical protein